MNLHQWILYFCLPFLVEGIRHLNALTHPSPQEPRARLNVADYTVSYEARRIRKQDRTPRYQAGFSWFLTGPLIQFMTPMS